MVSECFWYEKATRSSTLGRDRVVNPIDLLIYPLDWTAN